MDGGAEKPIGNEVSDTPQPARQGYTQRLAELAQEPLVQKAMELFDATIVRVDSRPPPRR